MGKSSDLTFRIFGKDKSASKTLKGVGATAGGAGKKLGGMGMAFAGIGTAAAIAGGVIAVDFGKKSVEAFMDAQDSQAKFEASLAKNGLKDYTKDIDELAGALALKTKFDDDATKSGAAVLANFGLTADQLKKTLPLVQDYAAFTGKDMPTASKLLGKAFLGNTKALKDLGIAYKPTGDKAADMAAIMDKVNDKVGGFAEKQGKTAAGTAAILTNQFGEVQEQLGSYLVPALTTLGQWIITYVIPAVQTLVGWLAEHLGPVFTTVGGWIMDTFVPAVKDLAASFMENVWPAIQQVAGMVAENLQPAIEALADFWTNTLQPGLVKAMPWFQKAAQWFGTVAAAVAVVVSWLIGHLVPAIIGVMTWIYNLGQNIATFVYDAKNRFLAIVDFVRSLPGKIASAASGMWNGITESFKGAINAIIGLWNNLSFSLPSIDIPGIGSVGGATLDTPNIPMLANGGIVTRPTLALIAEAGPEAVVPLGRGGMGGDVHIHITSPLGTPEQIARAVQSAVRKGRGSGGLAGAF